MLGTALFMPKGITVTLVSRTPNSSRSSSFSLSAWTKIWSASAYWIRNVNRLRRVSLESRLAVFTLWTVRTILFLSNRKKTVSSVRSNNSNLLFHRM